MLFAKKVEGDEDRHWRMFDTPVATIAVCATHYQRQSIIDLIY